MPRKYWKKPVSADETNDVIRVRDNLHMRVQAQKIKYSLLIDELKKHGIDTEPSELSKVFRGLRNGPKVEEMLRIITELVEAKEGEAS